MYNFTLLDKNNYIADDLENINLNYRSLNDWTLALESSAKNLWAPLVQLFTMRQPDWEFAISRTQQYSARWLSTATAVESYSASWIKPLSLIMPNIYTEDVNLESLLYTVSSWINTHFPVLPSFNAIPSYPENQEAFVYNYTHSDNIRVENLPLDLFASTTCLVYPGLGWANCTTRYSGVVNCDGGKLICDGQFKTCPVSKPVDCVFASPPYIADASVLTSPYLDRDKTVRIPTTKFKTVNINGIDRQVSYIDYETVSVPDAVKNLATVTDNTGKWSLGIGYIKARILFNYTDTRENTNIPCLKFKVKDCKWVYDSVVGKITSPIFELPVGVNCLVTIVDMGSEKKRGYYYVNNNGFVTLRIVGVGSSLNDYYEININGVSKLIPPGGGTVTFSGFYSRTYIARIVNLTNFTKRSFTVSIGYVDGQNIIYKAYDELDGKSLVYKVGNSFNIN